jgi:N-acetylglucosamine kinase
VVFGVILGSGVGGGLVIDGRLHAGHGGISGEWGHGPIVDPGAGGLTDRLPRVVCGCGHEGCLDPVGSARGLERIHALLSGESLQSEAIVGRWEEGDAAAAETVAVFVENIARALCVITNTIGASIVPVGGGLAGAPGLIAEIDRRVRALVMADYAEPLVVPGRHAKDGGLVGAALAAEAMEAAA